MSDCIFCKIVDGEIPCYNIFENDEFFAFLDIHPLNPGHVQVIPKKHCRWVWDYENPQGYFTCCQKIAKALQKAFETEWIVSLIIGEAVPHSHIWLVPRMANDGHGGSINLNHHVELSSEQMKTIQKRIVDVLSG